MNANYEKKTLKKTIEVKFFVKQNLFRKNRTVEGEIKWLIF